MYRSGPLALPGTVQAKIRYRNLVGQRYFGPVVLITDARCYSATDIFAAGFADHEIGPILTGLSRTVHVLQRDASVSDVVNMTAIAGVEAEDLAHAG